MWNFKTYISILPYCWLPYWNMISKSGNFSESFSKDGDGKSQKLVVL
jgi:hypothetical protein